MREAQRHLRLRLVKDDRLEGSVRLEPAPEAGVMLLEVKPGPKVNLKVKGLNWFGWLWDQPRLSDLPLEKAERYSPSLLEEGAGRLTTYFRNQGYPEAKVTYDRVVTAGTADRPQAVAITYVVERGIRRTLGKVSFEGNRELSEGEVRKAAGLPKRLLVLSPHAESEAVRSEERRGG